MKSFREYYQVLEEDLQSSINQARNILHSNNAGENTESILRSLKAIYDDVEFEDEQHRVANKDTNIPALAFWFIADPNYNRIRDDYRQYINTRSLYQKDFLINTVENLKKEITQRKLFKNPEEKLSLIKQTFSKLVETIHQEYIPPNSETSKKFVLGEKNEDVVYEDDNIIVYRADSKAKCIKYGSGSSLCISTKGGGNYYWSYRMGNMRNDGLGMTTYFVYWKNTDNRILIDALGDEDGPSGTYSWNPIGKNIDSDIKPEQLISKYPELAEPFSQNVFQFIPYGEKEERFAYIQNNVGSFEDHRLKTLEDYEMYIEGLDEISVYPITTWKFVERRVGKEATSYLVKKFGGLGNILDNNTTSEYLSPSDQEWYFDKLIESFDENWNYEEYFEKMRNTGISHKMIESYFSGYTTRDRDDLSLYDAIGEFIKRAIGGIDNVWDIAQKLSFYIKKHNIPASDFFLGKNVSSGLIEFVFENFNHIKSSEYPNFLISLLKYYKINNIRVPKAIITCIYNDQYLAAKYLHNWYLNRVKYHIDVGKPSEKLLKLVASKKSTAYYLLSALRYQIYRKELKIGENIPSYLVEVLAGDPYYKDFISELNIFVHDYF